MTAIAFEFGIVTDGSCPDRLLTICDSIRMQRIPQYHITIVGGSDHLKKDVDVSVVNFNESEKPKWITRKKNIITWASKYPNIVYLHDYVKFLPGWYEGWLRFGENYKAAMNKIMRHDGSRFRDWCLFPCQAMQEAIAYAGIGKHQGLLPYEETGFSKGMYFSGAYWVARKELMIEFPLDEKLVWGGGEDVIWSHQVRNKYDFSCNHYSAVQLIKDKKPVFTEIPKQGLEKMREFFATREIPKGYGVNAKILRPMDWV